jgi:hypothetical protein
MDKVQAAYELAPVVRKHAGEQPITIETVDVALLLAGQGKFGEEAEAIAGLANRWTVKRFALDPALTVEEAKMGKAAAAARDKAREEIAAAPDPKAPHSFTWSPNRGRCKVCNGGTNAAPHKAMRAQQATQVA